MTEGLRVETDAGVTTITLARPEKKNAITDAMYGGIAAALNTATADDAARAVVIAGDGTDFCAGNDISMFADGRDAVSSSNVGPFLEALTGFPKPIVAAVTGRAIGVGVTMLLHCDLVYVAHDTTLVTPFIDLGLVPEAGSGRLLPERIGHVRAFALFALGERLSGDEAAALGIANRALAADAVLPAAMAAARALAEKPASAIAATKRLMRDADTLRAALSADRDAFLRQLETPEAVAAFAAFAARKAPR
ncbi:MAG: enoyl-CoA hydratase/isomerase family protein [Sphingosinicella sp.]|nr:enoyl-CoA hydratase/isomerase family protein [Sphingosinicella sp.]